MCVSAEPRLQAALVSAAKVMRCIQCSLQFMIFTRRLINDVRQQPTQIFASAPCNVPHAFAMDYIYHLQVVGFVVYCS